MKRSEKAKAGTKFRVGQVVRVIHIRVGAPQYGRVRLYVPFPNRYIVEFWDADSGDIWEWEHDAKDLRSLTATESGQRQRKGKRA